MSCFKNVVTKKLLEIEIMFVEKVGVVNDFYMRTESGALPLWFSSDAFVLACLDFFVPTLCISLNFFVLTAVRLRCQSEMFAEMSS